MLGAIAGDIIGSVYEFASDKTKDFLLFSPGCAPTDDSLMTIAVGCTCISASLYNEHEFKATLVDMMREIGRQYHDCGYGDDFYKWLMSDTRSAYGSFGNGSAMRVSPVAYAAKTLDDVKRLARWSAQVTHDHQEAIAGAEAIACCVFLAKEGKSKDDIRSFIEDEYYPLNFTLDKIRPTYKFDVTCRGSVPQAIECFLESANYEDAVRNAVSLGGDGDTIAAMAGSIAEAYYGIPDDIAEEALSRMDDIQKEYYYEYADILYFS